MGLSVLLVTLANFEIVIQTLVILILFSLASFYLGKMIYKAFKADASCESGCGKCATSALDVDKIVKELRKKETFLT